MTTTDRTPRRLNAADLRRVIEPLADYICAADQPRALLQLACSALFDEVAAVTREARAHVAIRESARTYLDDVELSDVHSTRT
jgi:hypothetical protein